MRASAGTNSGPVPEYDTDKLNNSPREEEMVEVLELFAQRFPQGYFTVEGDSAAPNKSSGQCCEGAMVGTLTSKVEEVGNTNKIREDKLDERSEIIFDSEN
ncbi:hypothetical protein F4823DRAFT_567407 [Ustulina deusta]|nr:hypothetical protein F4823DRAFT_567407 [Ustulina deusta]